MPTIPVSSMSRRVDNLAVLLSMIKPVPEEWIQEVEVEGQELSCVDCDSYQKLTESWENALRWTKGLDRTLCVMLASILSTKLIGDQLWIKVIAPASTGKSTLCEALSVNREFVFAKSTIRGFHSGYSAGAVGEDHSLISKINGKTLVTKDGDTLLQSPNLGQILAEGRDLYDSTSRSHYRNAKGKDYSGIRMTWILCGTNSLRSIDHSELGERFLDCVIMQGIDEDLEDEILWRVANRAEKNMNLESDGYAESQHDPDLAKAMSLTGGYVEYLRRNAVDLMSKIKMGSIAKHQCTRLGKFVAFMRARPSLRSDGTNEREFAARLVSQHIRLAKCLTAVMNKDVVDAEVMHWVGQVALDTSRGHTLDLVTRMYADPDGVNLNTLASHTNQSEDQVAKLLRFLKHLKIVELNTKMREARTGARTRQTYWKLTPRIRSLYETVVDIA